MEKLWYVLIAVVAGVFLLLLVLWFFLTYIVGKEDQRDFEEETDYREAISSNINLAPDIILIRGVVGHSRMQVCVLANVTDDRIIDFCNRFNPSGTADGWTKVIRDKPVLCTDSINRLHLFVEC